MKKPLLLLAYGTLTLALLCSLFFILRPGENFKEGEGGEEEEGLPGVLLAMDLWSDMRTYPNPSMPGTGYAQAYEQTTRMSIAARGAEARVMSTTTAPWTNLAPMNFSGRVISLGFHPTNANIMWAGSAAGGLWKTTNGGTGAANGINWTPVNTGFPVLGVMSIAVHPTDGNTLYIGTGEVYNSNIYGGPTSTGNIRVFRGTYGIGILKTTDGGVNWTKSLNFDSTQLVGVAEIAINPSNTNIVYAATTLGVYRTTDGGANWTNVFPVPLAMDLQFKPGDPNVLYFTAGNFGSAGTGIYKCTNAAAASPTYSPINTGITLSSGKIMITMVSTAPNTIFASVGREPDTSDPFGLYKSTNEGASWTQIGDATLSSVMGTNSKLNQGWYAHDVSVDPSNLNNILWGEQDLYRTTNGGSTFTRETQWNLWSLNPATGVLNESTTGGSSPNASTNYLHADVHRLIISPFSSTTIFALTDGGVYKSTDNGLTFVGLNGGLCTAQIYANMGISKLTPNLMIGGLQDNEGFIWAGTSNCRRVGNLGDGFHSVISPTDDNIMFTESYYLNVSRSTDKFVNAGNRTTVINNGQPGNAGYENACFNSPLVVAPSNGNIMYAGSIRMKKSTNGGTSFSNVGPNPLSASDAMILYIAVAPSDPNTLYVSVAPGQTSGTRSKLFKSTNGGTNFTEITGSLPNRYYSDIAIDYANPSRLAVTVSGFGSSHVYLSLDAGTTWSDVSGDLPNLPHNTLMFDPNNRRTLYVGNDAGVFYAHGLPTGSGALPATTPATWIAYNEGIEPVMLVSDLQVNTAGKLRMATYGRGLWERDLAPTSTLPFVFKKFNVRETADGNKLDWTISTQGNVVRYEVEYSNDAISFRKVGTVDAVSAAGDINYTYLHRITNDMDGFYRIKIISADNTYEYSVVESVKAKKLITKLTAFPNPTTGAFKVKIPTNSRGALNLQLYDNAGKLLMAKRVELGTTDVPMRISRFPAGTYQLVLEGFEAKWATRILKK